MHSIVSSRRRRAGSFAVGVAFALLICPIVALAQPCVVPDNGSGTVNLPPAGCGYVSPTDLHMMIDGLPPGTTIQVAAEHQKFFNVTTNPGGSLGGEVENFSSILVLHLTGTGSLGGFGRNMTMNAQCQTHTAPRAVGDPVQSFDTDMFMIQGQITGDPDFDLLRITAGTGFGMPSPGHTTLTRLPSGNFNVDSFFDIEYRIDFVGRPGSVLGGMSGSTTGTIRMQTGQAVTLPDPCTVAPDPATGVVHLPPQGCGYVSPTDLHMMIDGLPPGTTITVDAKHDRFFNPTETPGGSLGGSVENFQSFLGMGLTGTGDLAGFSRALNMQIQCQTHTGPRDPAAPFQSFDTEMFMMQGQLPPGDPDFDLLRITGGGGFGMPSPGHTTLARLPSGQFAVDSFFDITYRIDFVGAPGGPLAGMSGSTTGTIRMRTGDGTTSDSEVPAPKATKLMQNVPNPFNPSTKISFEIATAGKVQLLIVDAKGRVVRHLVDSNMMPNRYTMLWDGNDDRGRKAASGTYYYTLIAPDFKESRSMVLLK